MAVNPTLGQPNLEDKILPPNTPRPMPPSADTPACAKCVKRERRLLRAKAIVGARDSVIRDAAIKIDHLQRKIMGLDLTRSGSNSALLYTRRAAVDMGLMLEPQVQTTGLAKSPQARNVTEAGRSSSGSMAGEQPSLHMGGIMHRWIDEDANRSMIPSLSIAPGDHTSSLGDIMRTAAASDTSESKSQSFTATGTGADSHTPGVTSVYD